MKGIVAAVLGLLLSRPGFSEDIRMSEKANKAAVSRIYEECINRGKTELLQEIISAGYVGPQGELGPAGFAKTVNGLRNGFPDIKFHIEEIVAEGDIVMLHWTWQGTHKGKAFGGFDATNRLVQNDGMVVY